MRSGPSGPLFFYWCGLNIPDNTKLLSGTGRDALAAIPAAPRMAMSGMAGMNHSMPMASAPAGAPGHSGRAMPGIEALYKKVDKSKVAFVMLSLDDDPATVRKFVKNRGYTFLMYLRTGDLPAPFGSNSISSTVVLGPDGQVAGHHDSMTEYDTPEFKASLEQLAKTVD